MSHKVIASALFIYNNLIIKSKISITPSEVKIFITDKVVARTSIRRSELSLREYSVITRLNANNTISIKLSGITNIRYHWLHKDAYSKLLSNINLKINGNLYYVYLETLDGLYRIIMTQRDLRKLLTSLHSNK